MNNQNTGGYMTVEASLILPMVLLVYVWIISLLFFQYNRALLEQDAVICLVTESAPSKIKEEKYMWCTIDSAEKEKTPVKEEIALEACFTGPYFRKICTTCSHYRIDAPTLLRQKRKIENILKEKESS